ncbi:MAG: biosynthetic-type acetolactate synthase large subunit [Candidatus Eremiobacteraeota bacterium]|nr:biosynthetic-type acetolactate synthase large subunit [Candidatus Eremiobacteraeota bacterium]
MSQSGDATGAQLVLDVLVDEGVDVVFGYPGGAIMPLYDALHSHHIEHILTRHEAAAAFAAGGYARSSGRVGVCLATSGPGATNLVTGILDAQMDSVPIVAITGQVRTALMGTDGFQEADVSSIMGPVTKRSVCVRDIGDLERTLRAAFRLARGPRPGTVSVDIPTDILKARCPKMDVTAARALEAVPETPSDTALDEALDVLLGAQRPVAIVGGGARSADATRAFRELMAVLEIPHTATINGLGCASPGDPNFLGMLGMHGWKAANLAVNGADVVLALGMRFDDRVTGRPDRFAQHAQVIHADVDASEFGKIVPVRVALRGDLRLTLEQLTARVKLRSISSFAGWTAQARALGGALPADRAPHGELSATDVLDALFAVAPADTIVATDVGQHQMWAAQRQRAIHPRNFITSAGLGSMGFGLPAALGAQRANPERTVIAVCGDGGFQMSIAELATVRRYALPVKILLIDNRRLGMVRQWQELFYDGRFSHTDLSDNPDFVAIAAGYGIRAERVEDAGELRDALERFIAADEPMLLHCACFPAENVWPLIPPGATVHDAMESAPIFEPVPA